MRPRYVTTLGPQALVKELISPPDSHDLQRPVKLVRIPICCLVIHLPGGGVENRLGVTAVSVRSKPSSPIGL